MTYYLLLVTDNIKNINYIYENNIFLSKNIFSQFEEFIKDLMDNYTDGHIQHEIHNDICKVYSLSDVQNGWIWNSKITKKTLIFELSLISVLKPYDNTSSEIGLQKLLSLSNQSTQTSSELSDTSAKNNFTQTKTLTFSENNCQTNSLYHIDNNKSTFNLQKNFSNIDETTQTNLDSNSLGYIMNEFLDEIQDRLAMPGFGLI